MKAQELYALLAKQGISIFMIRIDDFSVFSRDYVPWIHFNKSRDEFRADIKAFQDKGFEEATGDFSASNNINNSFYSYLKGLGYLEVSDVAVDVFEGKITNEKARLVDDPDHEEQLDGFGHFGWESKND